MNKKTNFSDIPIVADPKVPDSEIHLDTPSGDVVVFKVDTEKLDKLCGTQPPSKPESGDKVSDDEEVSIETLTSHVEYTFESEQYKNIVNTPKDNILGFMESCHEVIQSLRKSHSALVEENEKAMTKVLGLVRKIQEEGDSVPISGMVSNIQSIATEALAKYSKEGDSK